MAANFYINPSDNNHVNAVMHLTRNTSGTATTGLGQSINFNLQQVAGTILNSGKFNHLWTTITAGAEVSSFEWWLANNGVLTKKMELKGSGQLLLAGYGTGAFSLGTPVYYLQVDANGNILEGALGAGSMVYPAAGIALSTGSSWGASIINNSTQWNTAYGWGNHAGLYAIAPAANTADYIPQWNGTNSKVLKDGLAVPAGGLAGNTALAAKQPRLTITGVKVSNYSANADEFVPYDISASNPTLTLPTAPATGTIIQTKIIVEGTTRTLEVKTGGTDTFNIGGGGDTSIYYNLLDTVVTFTYNSSTGVWYVETTAPPSAFAMGFPGIDAQTPITNSDISIDTSTFVLTITPPLGYFYVNAAGGNGKNIRIRKTGVINFPAFTDTSGIWYFYFDNTGAPITTQVAWSSEDFANISPVYRIVWNATLAGAARLVRRFVEYHLNDIPHDTHVWMHLHGAIWSRGLDIASNVIASPTSPASDGSNAVIALTTGTCIDDNLAYTITNDSTPTNDWEQDLGNITPASLNATNSALFQVRYRNGAGLVFFLPATRFPFDWNSGTNVPQWITSTGTRTPVTNTYHFVYFVYITQDPKVGTAISIVSAPAEYSNITNARAVSWTDIQNTYTYLNDGEIRPLYKLIFEYKTSYDVGTKYSALREIADLRKAAVTSTTVASGSIPASSVTVIPTGDIASTNVQSALAEIDSEKQTKRSLLSTTLPINVAETTLSGASFK